MTSLLLYALHIILLGRETKHEAQSGKTKKSAKFLLKDLREDLGIRM
jgi:hypothetical protein